MTRPITERMAEAIRLHRAHWPNRSPAAFYLSPDDWRDFIATKPPTISAKWNLGPTSEPGFDSLPVRQSTSETSRLYDSVRQGKVLPA